MDGARLRGWIGEVSDIGGICQCQVKLAQATPHMAPRPVDKPSNYSGLRANGCGPQVGKVCALRS
jgi:hypothetical protein